MSPAAVALPRRILGVDFSGAADAGRRIWITQAHMAGGRLHVEACDSAVTLLQCAPSPGASHAALVEFLRRTGGCVVGCDFPFSLSAAMIPERSWPRFLAEFPRRYRSAAAFYRETHRRWGEPRRVCDAVAQTPFAPNNLRLYRQTYHGLRNILLPLVGAGAACALPLQRPRAGVPWLLECCPASALKRLGLYQPSYKGTGAARARRRGAILRELEAHGALAPVPAPLRSRVVAQAGGDALDSLLAAWIAFQAVLSPGTLLPAPPDGAAIEGHVYAGFGGRRAVRAGGRASSPSPVARPRPAGRG